MENRPLLDNKQLDYINQHFTLSTSSDGIAGRLIWKECPSNPKNNGSFAGSFDKSKGVHFTKIAGKKLPTLAIIHYLHFRRVVGWIETKGIQVPSVTTLQHVQTVANDSTIFIDGKGYDLRRWHSSHQAYLTSELKDGIRRDEARGTYRLYMHGGQYLGSFSSEKEAVVVRAALCLREKLASDLRKLFFAHQWGWSFPVLSKAAGKYVITNGDAQQFCKTWISAARLYINIYRKNKEEETIMSYDGDAYAGIENFVSYDAEDGTFTYKSGKTRNPVHLNAGVPVIRYNGMKLSAAKVVYYLMKGAVPTKRVKFLDKDVSNLRPENLTTDIIRRTKKITENVKHLL